MNKKMTKREIIGRKKKAKARKNRQLSDGEHHRIMAKAMSEGLEEDIKCDIIDMNSGFRVSNEREDFVPSSTPALLQKQISKALMDVAISDRAKKRKSTKKNRRLSEVSYENLMKKISDELGINDNKYTLLNLMTPNKPLTPAKLAEQILFTLSYSQRDVYNEYYKLIKKKRLSAKDRMGVIAWLMYPKEVLKPMCLIPTQERTKAIRNDIVGLKKWGDVKIRPLRVIPDNEYIREIKGEKRKNTDVFDRMSLDKKIIWARHAKGILGKHSKTVADGIGSKRVQDLFNTNETDLIHVAMKYACKMIGMTNFRSVYATPYWIIYRVNQYCGNSTAKEYDVFLDVVQSHMGWSDKKSIPLLTDKEFNNKLMEILKTFGLEDEYLIWHKKNENKVGIERLATHKVRSMVQDYYKTH